MVEPSTTYEIGRMSVVVELVRLRRGESMWLVCANRRASARFINTGAVARCSNRENAQALARMLAGVEFTRDGAAIWLDGRTEQSPPTPDPVDTLIAAIHAMPVDDTGETVGARIDALNAATASPSEPMEIKDAIEIVLDLAHQNVIDEREFPELCAHQMKAYDLVSDLLSGEHPAPTPEPEETER